MGAEVTMISEKDYKVLNEPPLEQLTNKLYGPSLRPLQAKGKFLGTLLWKEKYCSATNIRHQGSLNQSSWSPSDHYPWASSQNRHY